jgi:uncharacterized protein (DUF1697 family)
VETYVAFLRGINVSGKNLMKMTDLKQMFEDMKYKKVSTYIQSGNVTFDTKETDVISLGRKIEKALHKALGYELSVFVRSKSSLQEMIAKAPFAAYEGEKSYVAFFDDAAKKPLPVFPYFNEKAGVLIFEWHDTHAFCISRQTAKGDWGFPNPLIEKEMGIPATTRNWNTVMKMGS